MGFFFIENEHFWVGGIMTQRRNMLHNIMAISIFMVITIALIPGCSSEPKRDMIPASANVNEEISSLSEDLKIAKQDQIDVLSPRNFEKAHTHYSNAQSAREKNKDNQDILKSVGMAKAYLILANEHAERTRSSAADILKAREEAIASGAHQHLPKKFERADSELKNATLKAERNRTSLEADRRADLQRNYFDVHVESLKIAYLDPVEGAIEAAKKNGARRFASRTLAAAEAKTELASNVIETDRNNTAEIKRAAASANKEAIKLLNVTSIARNNKVSENVALELNANRNSANVMNAELSQVETRLKKEREVANEMRAENEALEKKNQFNESFAWAQEQFNPNEAEVFRQGDQLLIRLKSMNYKSGQKELPSASYPVLSKVKAVIAKMGAEKVRVEGHTDSTGNKTINEELSQARAENVAQYLADDKLIGKNQIEAEGLGFQKPVSNNSTSEGRAQNRRVDIIVTPGQVETEATSIQ